MTLPCGTSIEFVENFFLDVWPIKLYAGVISELDRSDEDAQVRMTFSTVLAPQPRTTAGRSGRRMRRGQRS